jgi:large subunit ribosomal protein L13
MKTVSIKPEAARAARQWWVLDLDNRVLGRTAARVAGILRGKHKASYTPHVDTGDFVIVVNAEKVRLTGRKLDQKMYYRHSGYIGGIRRRRRARCSKPTRSG